MNPTALQTYASWLPGRARRPFLMPEHAVLVAMKDPSLPGKADAWQPTEVVGADGPIPGWLCLRCGRRVDWVKEPPQRHEPLPGQFCDNPWDDGVLVSGVGLFPTKGAFLMVEQFSTNPEVPARVRHAAAKLTFEVVRIHAAVVGKLPFFITNTLGLYKLAKKLGWVPHARAAVLEADPLHPLVALGHKKVRAPATKQGPSSETGRMSNRLAVYDTMTGAKVPVNGKKKQTRTARPARLA